VLTPEDVGFLRSCGIDEGASELNRASLAPLVFRLARLTFVLAEPLKFWQSFRRNDLLAALSRALHPSGGHFQSSLVGLRARARHLPLEGLRPRWQARPDDPCRHGVLTALLSARAPQRVRTHPSLRIPRESLTRFSLGAVPTTSELHFPWVRRNWNLPNSLREFYPLALPALRCSHDRDSKIYRRGTINMCLPRFFVALSSVALCRRAPARRSIREFTRCRHALTQLSVRALVGTRGAVDDLHAAFPIRRCSSSSRLGTKLPFKSHNSTRPPQTPAASS
jgi:hypothetical protein